VRIELHPGILPLYHASVAIKLRQALRNSVDPILIGKPKKDTWVNFKRAESLIRK